MNSGENSTFIEIGLVTKNLHHGLFASHWWHEATITSLNKKKLYPIRLNLRMHHIYNKITIFTYVYQGNGNSPVFQSSINEFVVNSNDMTNSVNAVYDQYLQSNKNQDKFKMFVINASYNATGPSDGYHITFVERFRHEHVIFSQFYNNNLYHVNLYSLNIGELLYEHQNSDVNVLWKSIGLFQKYSGRQLFLLENAEMKQIIEKTIIFQVSCSEWDPIIFDKLHSTYIKHFYRPDGQQRILSIIAEKFSYSELENCFNISNNLITAAGKYARIYGEVFDSLTELISASNIYLAEKNYLIDKIELLKRHLKHGLDEEIKVLNNGHLQHTSCNSISTGEDIANSNKGLAGTLFAKLIPDCSKKISVGTIPGISNYFTFMWPTGEKEGTIEAYEIPHYGSPKTYPISHIKRLLKNNDIKQPDSIEIDQTAAQMEWKMNIPSQIDPSIQKLTVTEQ
ncbi:9052_t:CDS:2 [Entrophospora sp. SA101]|nr:9052_t:CDS:2 [Entrophospora sp. SA101]